MYDELIAEINETRDDCRDSDFIESAYIGELLGKAADAIEELTDTNVGKWIPVTERLPEDLTRVIVFCEDGVSFGLCEHLIADDEEVVEWHDFLHYPITPTHWMPLPEPPKEET